MLYLYFLSTLLSSPSLAIHHRLSSLTLSLPLRTSLFHIFRSASSNAVTTIPTTVKRDDKNLYNQVELSNKSPMQSNSHVPQEKKEIPVSSLYSSPAQIRDYKQLNAAVKSAIQHLQHKSTITLYGQDFEIIHIPTKDQIILRRECDGETIYVSVRLCDFGWNGEPERIWMDVKMAIVEGADSRIDVDRYGHYDFDKYNYFDSRQMQMTSTLEESFPESTCSCWCYIKYNWLRYGQDKSPSAVAGYLEARGINEEIYCKQLYAYMLGKRKKEQLTTFLYGVQEFTKS